MVYGNHSLVVNDDNTNNIITINKDILDNININININTNTDTINKDTNDD